MSDGGRSGDAELAPLIWTSSLDGMLVVDSSMRVRVFNDEARRVLGASLGPDEPITAETVQRLGIMLPDRKTPLPLDALPFTRALQGAPVRNQVMYVKNPRVAGTFISVSAGPLRDDRGEVVGVVTTFRDVTSFVERDEFRREMTHLLAHDLKSVLGGVLMSLSLARGEAKEEDALADADEGARRAVRLVTNLLDVTRLEQGRLVPRPTVVDVAGLLRHAANLRRAMAREQDVDLDVLGPDLVKLRLDAELIARVIDNILDNAFRYTPAGGRVVLSVAPTAGGVELRLGNTGPPIPAEARALIFQKNVRLSHAAAHHTYGLGLYFSRMVVEAHGGKLHVESTKDLPTVFVVELPVPRSADGSQPG